MKRVAAAGPFMVVAGLHGFAVAAPLFETLSANPEFLVAHHLTPLEVPALATVLCFGLPSVFFLLEAVARRIHRQAGLVIHFAVVAALAALLVLRLPARLFDAPAWVVAVSAGLLGAVTAVFALRSKGFAAFLRFVWPSGLVFAAVFLLTPAVRELWMAPAQPETAVGSVQATTPVVLVVFDELPLATLLDERGRINRARFKNFAALSEESYWFSNATTVAELTDLAVPAILTGRYPWKPSSAIVENYPDNLFTWLAGSYDFHIVEGATQLCPGDVCRETDPVSSFEARLRTTLADITLIYLHTVLPAGWSRDLPDVTEGWTDFWPATREDPQSGRGEPEFTRFLAAIQVSSKPTLHFIHNRLPHGPFFYLPSSKSYGPGGFFQSSHGMSKAAWTGTEWETLQALQRHLLQVGFVDRLLGDLITRLRGVDLYDRSLLIVTSDHGAAFRKGSSYRLLSEDRPGDIMAVPLFVKLPHQKHGSERRENVESVDILPTIADVLNEELPFPTDGYSMLDREKDRVGKSIYSIRHKTLTRLDSQAADVQATVVRTISIFGTGEDPDSVYRFGRYSSLVNRSINEFPQSNSLDLEMEMQDPDSFDNVDLTSSFIPAQIAAWVLPRGRIGGSRHIAVAVNGTIRAVTQTFQSPVGDDAFSAMVPESAFVGGSNRIQTFLLSGPPERPELTPLRDRTKTIYSLKRFGSQEMIVSSAGETIPIVPDKAMGMVDIVSRTMGYMRFVGWAAGVAARTPVEEVLVFSNGVANHAFHTRMVRTDVAKHFKSEGLRLAGFSVVLPKHSSVDEMPEFRVFGVSASGYASELKYRSGYALTARAKRIDIFNRDDN